MKKRSLCVFEPFEKAEGLGATCSVHLKLIGKLFVLIELFSLGVMAEAL